jgi:hypothetical protein
VRWRAYLHGSVGSIWWLLLVLRRPLQRLLHLGGVLPPLLKLQLPLLFVLRLQGLRLMLLLLHALLVSLQVLVLVLHCSGELRLRLWLRL